MNKKELPIGTVVMLVGGTKKVMITGYRSKNADADKVFDYNGCVFPEGLMENIYCLFDASQIEDVLYKGLENDEQQDYVQKFNNSNSFSGKGTRIDTGNISSEDRSTGYHKPPRVPKNTRSKSEMLSKYGVTKMSDDIK